MQLLLLWAWESPAARQFICQYVIKEPLLPPSNRRKEEDGVSQQEKGHYYFYDEAVFTKRTLKNGTFHFEALCAVRNLSSIYLTEEEKRLPEPIWKRRKKKKRQQTMEQ